MKKENKKLRVELRLNSSEAELFQKKAKRYGNMSAMIRDAVAQFNDVATIGKVDALNNLSDLIKKFSAELAKEGSNLNQVTKRANELMLLGDLDRKYYEEEVKPIIDDIHKIMMKIQRRQAVIFKKLIHL